MKICWLNVDWQKNGLILLILVLLVSGEYNQALGQTKGLIVKPATGAGKAVLDPNQDGYASVSGQGFLSNDLAESEIPYRPLPLPFAEPVNDLRTGAAGGFTDFADIPGGIYSVGSYLTMVNSNTPGNFMFRFRLGGIAQNSKGYSILIDSDGKFGNSGPDADPEYSIHNPGFEFEIVLATSKSVSIYNINNSAGTATLLTTNTEFPYSQHCQKAIAITTNSGNPDYFYDFYLPFSSLQSKLAAAGIAISHTTPLRMSAVTLITAKSAIKGPISDIAGVNDNVYTSPAAAWETIIKGAIPTSPADLTNNPFPSIRSVAPQVTGNLTGYAYNTVTGTSTEPAGTVIKVYKNGQALTGTTTVNANGTWVYPSTGTATVYLENNDKITATATVAGKSESLHSNVVTAGSSASCAAQTPTPVYAGIPGSCSGVRSFQIGNIFSGNAAPAGTKVYVTSAAHPTVILNASPNNQTGGTFRINGQNYATIPDNEFWYKHDGDYSKCGTNTSMAGTYFVTAQETNKCLSETFIYQVYPSNSPCATPPANYLTVNQAAITPQTTTLSGTSGTGTGTGISVFVDNVLYKGFTITTNTTSWSITGLNFSAGQVVKIYAYNASYCISAPITFTVAYPATTTPVLDGPIYSNAAKVTGISAEAAGTQIFVQLNGSQLGTTTVSSNCSWEYNLPTSTILTNSCSFTATALAAGKSMSATSDAVGVQLVLAPAPAAPAISLINGVAYKEGETIVRGTVSAGMPLGTRIRLYIDEALADSTVTTGSGGNAANHDWEISTLGPVGKNLYTGAELKATATLVTGTTITSFESEMSVGVLVECNPPAAFTAVPAVASVQAGDKVEVLIANSQAGVIYTIKENGIDAGTSVLGTGNALPVSVTSDPVSTGPTKTFTVVAQNMNNDNCSTTSFTTTPVAVIFPELQVRVKAILGGPWSGTAMTTSLNTPNPLNLDFPLGLLAASALTNPFTGAPWNYTGGESVLSTFFGLPGNRDIVDWILVELRSTATGAAVARKAGFIKSDGSIIDVDGSDHLKFTSAPAGDYYIVVKHRNHLPIMSSMPVSLPNAAVYDFTSAMDRAYGYASTSAPMKDLGNGKYSMWPGDCNGNFNVIYTGNNNDVSPIQAIVGVLTSAGVTGYFKEDVDLSGFVRFTGNVNDVTVVHSTVGSLTSAAKQSGVPNPHL